MRLRPSTILLLIAPLVLGCSEAVVPGDDIALTASRIVLSPDTIAVTQGSTVTLTAKVYAANDALISGAPIEWTAEPSSIHVTNGQVTGDVGHVYGSVVAKSGSATAQAAIWVQTHADSIILDYHAATVSPGASFIVGVFPVPAPGSDLFPYPFATAPKLDLARRFGLIGSSNPAVANWMRYDSPGWVFTTYSVGETDLTVSYGGATRVFHLVVRSPVLSVMDELQRCGLTSDGEAWCKGDNDLGQLGTRTARAGCCSSLRYQQGSAVPIAVDVALRFTRITNGGTHACAIGVDRAVYCWGDNRYSNLGSTSGIQDCLYVFTGDITDGPRRCSFAPLRVDRELGQVLLFDDVKAEVNAFWRTCGHVTSRGPTAESLASVDEIWCWGGTYGKPPQQRPAYFQ